MCLVYSIYWGKDESQSLKLSSGFLWHRHKPSCKGETALFHRRLEEISLCCGDGHLGLKRIEKMSCNLHKVVIG